MRRARRRGRALGRSLLLHLLVLALVGLALLARMSESSDAQLAQAERGVALARLEPPAARVRHSGSEGWPLPAAPGAISRPGTPRPPPAPGEPRAAR